jgi:Ca-activated chloride channel family protein
MTFANPELLLGLLLVPLALGAYLLVQRRRSRYVVRFTNVDLLANLVPHRPRWRRHVPAALYLVAIAALAVALARPSMTLPVARQEATVMLTMDTSRSMLATDVSPSRLDAAKAAATTFVDQLPSGFRVGLVAFSTEARLVLQPTADRAAFTQALDSLRADGGTALGDAIALSLQATADARPAVATNGAAGNGGAADATSPAPSAPADGGPVSSAEPGATDGTPPLTATVLLSDGANSTGALEPLQAADEAAAAGMPVYTIALGTPDGVVQVTDQFGQPHELSVPPDTETLSAVADATGGRFYQAPSADDLAQIYAALGTKVGYTQQTQEVTQWFAAAGLLLVLSGAGLAAVWFNRFP